MSAMWFICQALERFCNCASSGRKRRKKREKYQSSDEQERVWRGVAKIVSKKEELGILTVQKKS